MTVIDDTGHVTPETEFDSDLATAVKGQLREVLDPCSCMSNHPIDIIDLGLVDDIAVDEAAREARIDILLTSQRCMYVLDITDEIRERVESLSGIETADVHQVTSGKVWTAERMSEEQQTERRERFEERIEAADITPYAEQSSES
ncbi:iron-sulfur cluster assembly protein [Haloarcula sp. S1CR25-12]|uniref:Iron-sulfur cluster assembly protein n=1 Tax=Haloarcula saliterrae TaxID=2950534 RepID=A0ABU2FFB3_9EURY|nr:iron-sulfur cluster assembly protein [Haloarcula sp. S1CR25-12]MDS0260932.1 iron-sulfur cluster assembly protein [Haloarcula sp. S1CR25-12]